MEKNKEYIENPKTIKDLIQQKKQDIKYNSPHWSIPLFLLGAFFSGIILQIYYNNLDKLILLDDFNELSTILKILFYVFTLILPIIYVIINIISYYKIKRLKQEIKILSKKRR